MIDINISVNSLLNIKNTAEENGCTVSENASLKDITTFKTGGTCPLLITPKTEDGLSAVIKAINKENVPFIVLGNGSNVLAPDGELKKIVIKTTDGLCDLYLKDGETIFAGAGVKLAVLCKFALENSLSGLEFAYGIPGSCGGAAFMNGGAYGGEMKDVLTRVYHIDKNGNKGSFAADELMLSYRTSVYEKTEEYIITGVEIKLKKGNPEEIKSAMDGFISRRKEKQPLEYPSAGSTFKRPEGHFAGALIENCGLKGKEIGGAAVSEKHAGFLINKNNATSEDVLKLIDFVRETVLKETGVTLEPEVRIL